MICADEYWQATEPAYKSVYGDVQNVALPWEWSDEFRLRNCIYPMFLSLPLHLVRFLGIDTNLVVRSVPYLTHYVFVVANDVFFWKIAKRLVVRDAAKLAFILYFFNRFETMHLIRTIGNSLE